MKAINNHLQFRIAALLAAILITFLIASTVVNVTRTTAALTESERARQQQITAARASELQGKLSGAKTNLLYLSGTPSLRSFARAGNTQDPVITGAARSFLTSYIKKNTDLIAAICLLDFQGN